MKKIKNAIIHLLGGVTAEECVEECEEVKLISMHAARFATYCEVLEKMDKCYGMSAHDWCNNMYNFVKKTVNIYEVEIKN